METEFLNFKKLMINIIIWFATWGVLDGIMYSFKFSKDNYTLICFIILIISILYVTYNDKFSWKFF